jgi:hypothetical protein
MTVVRYLHLVAMAFSSAGSSSSSRQSCRRFAVGPIESRCARRFGWVRSGRSPCSSAPESHLRPVPISGGTGHSTSNSRSFRLWPPWSFGTCAVRSCTRSRPGRHRIARDRLAWRIVGALNARGATNRGTNLRNGADLADPHWALKSQTRPGPNPRYLVVVQAVAGSTPITHPSRKRRKTLLSPPRGMERPLSPGPKSGSILRDPLPRATRPSTLSGAGPRKPGYLFESIFGLVGGFRPGASRQYRSGSSRAGPRRPSPLPRARRR